MTWLWTALIVVGVVMIAVALWPGGRGRGARPGDEGDPAEQPDDR